MAVKAGELHELMKLRLEMQEQGITNPSASVREATHTLVNKLASLEPSESIEITSGFSPKVKYIRVLTGELLAEISEV